MGKKALSNDFISTVGNRSSRLKVISPKVMSPKPELCRPKFLVKLPEGHLARSHVARNQSYVA